jgi:hypothetical protein
MKATRTLAAMILILSLLGGAGCGSGKVSAWPVTQVDGTSLVARTQGRYLEIYTDNGWERISVKGVNIGTALPGKWFSEFPEDKNLYLGWFKQIGALHANTIRVYTLLDPIFYEALDEFNRTNPSQRLWLLQEIWPDDIIPDNNLYDSGFTNDYLGEIALDLGALHGGYQVAERLGRAWGKYNADIYPYLLGVIIGREISAEEIQATNQANPGKGDYQGRFIRTSGASPAEVWTAEMCDYTAAYAQDNYGWQVPVSFVSWPTLDPMNHSTEFTPGGDKSLEADDSQVFDPAHLSTGPEAKAGLFGTYHIYPYYPDFMYREPAYAEYRDEEGVLRYGAYLREFMSVHPPYPALVGEFGLSTSLGAAHLHPEGLNHGDVSEEEQGLMISRMLRAIFKEGYAGGLVFEWADEWAKRAWITMPYMIPFDRHIYWHNLMDPEQNFGILAYESDHIPFSGEETLMWNGEATSGGAASSGGTLSSLYADHDEGFLYLRLGFSGGSASALRPESGQDRELQLGLDTFGRDNGTVRLPMPGLPDLPSGVELLLKINSRDGARLLARPDYNLGTSNFAAAPANDDTFVPIEVVTNRHQVDQFNGTDYPEVIYNESLISYGVFNPSDPQYNSLADWYVDDGGDNLYVRLPWALLNVSDPSSNTIIHDNRTNLPAGPAALRVDYGRDALGVERTGGFRFYAALSDAGGVVYFMPRDGAAFSADVTPYIWQGWDQPLYRPRLKKSYEIISEAFAENQ